MPNHSHQYQPTIFHFDNLESGLLYINEPIISKIAEIAKHEGVNVYIVGGYVRDYYLNRQRHDFDFTVIGDALAFAKKVAAEFNSKAVIYERFRTAMVPIGEYQCEFVGTRKEVYEANSRKPIVTEGTLEDDLRRRDFTINAMAARLNESSVCDVIDLFDGKEDLKNGILRTPLDPIATFSDDPLRMMRAARFASQLNFQVEQSSLDACKKMADRIEIISRERISDEFLRIIDSPVPSVGLAILYNTGLLKYFFKELDELAGVDIVEKGSVTYAHKDVFWHSLKVLDNAAQKTDNTWLRFAALVHDIAKSRTKRFNPDTGWTFHGHEEIGARMMKKIFRQMKFPMEHLDYVEKLIRLHQRPMQLVDEEVTDSAIRRLAVHAGEALEDLFILVRADITTKNPNRSQKYTENYEKVFAKVLEVQAKDKLRDFQSPVRGEEIMRICNLDPSKAVGIIKHNIEEAILEGIIKNDYDEAKDYFLSNKDVWLASMSTDAIKSRS